MSMGHSMLLVLTFALSLPWTSSALPLLFQSNSTFLSGQRADDRHQASRMFVEQFNKGPNSASNTTAGQLRCEGCKLLVFTVKTLFNEGKTWDEIVILLTETCTLLKFQHHRVCVGIVQAFKTEVLTVIAQLVLSPSEVCGVLVGSECGTPYDPMENWNVSLPKTPKPPVVPPKPPSAGSSVLRVLHISDIHYDAKYKAGTNAVCHEPLCCRDDDSPSKAGTHVAGFWGDDRECDPPLWTLENLFQHLRNKSSEFDYVLWTGDLPAHNVWNQTRADQIALIEKLTQLFKTYFPNKLVYSSLGNHESAPVNSFPPPFIRGNNSISWLYEAVADSWLNWLPPDTKPTIIKGSYYTVSPYPGLRIVSINTNYCNNENWWLLLNTTDPANQLSWLVSVLEIAEKNMEKVHILGHIPPGTNDCLKAWSWNYFKIVNRFESTISAQFFGHTHHDEFEVFYDDVHFTRPVSVAYIVPSITAFDGLNLGYRIYEIDGNYINSSWAVLDHETYVMDLAEANKPGHEPRWDLEYTAKATYNMTSLFPEDWSKVIHQLEADESLFNTFHKFFYKSHASQTCDAKCRLAMICRLKSGRSHDPSHCSNLNTHTRLHH